MLSGQAEIDRLQRLRQIGFTQGFAQRYFNAAAQRIEGQVVALQPERLFDFIAQGIQVDDIVKLKGKGIDILDIGVAILDAPLLDMRLEVRE